jgi:ribonuclease HI
MLVLWSCPTAIVVWQECNRRLQKIALVANDGYELVKAIFEKLSSEEVLEACTMARAIWLRGNSFVFAGEFLPPIQLVERSRMVMEEYSTAHNGSSSTINNTPMTPPRWTKPPDDMWKINVDAAVDKRARKMGVGVVIRDAGGRIIAAWAKQIPFIVDPLLAETIAAWYAISFGKEMGRAKVILEGDSLLVASALEKEGANNQAHGQLLPDIRSSFSSFLYVQVHHVTRKSNMAAHVLARSALSQFLDKVWIGECPIVIQSIVPVERDGFIQ